MKISAIVREALNKINSIIEVDIMQYAYRDIINGKLNYDLINLYYKNRYSDCKIETRGDYSAIFFDYPSKDIDKYMKIYNALLCYLKHSVFIYKDDILSIIKNGLFDTFIKYIDKPLKHDQIIHMIKDLANNRADLLPYYTMDITNVPRFYLTEFDDFYKAVTTVKDDKRLSDGYDLRMFVAFTAAIRTLNSQYSNNKITRDEYIDKIANLNKIAKTLGKRYAACNDYCMYHLYVSND